ncbi:hypothetical protein DPMN_017059 [Dreissena polymorpha]|uniref:Uncharacterized protein n=1 Tax=Dreissena polymorpha TaxID=45954 RepID=A0A9D4NAR7_DREPO|nr:hypothetical protein DPMN_017059 [Dreissena polymorpha]
MKSMKAIEENAEKDLTLSDELTSRIKEASRKSADSFNDSEDETMEKINVKDDGVTGEDAIIIFKPEETEEENCFDEIEELIEDEIHSIEDVKNASVKLKETSIKNELERSFSEGKGRRSAEVVKVIDRKSAPRVMLEYEPSTTEAESGLSDSDTLDTESLQEDFGSHGSARKSKHMVKPKQGQSKKVNQQSILAVDTEVARMFNESPSTGSLRVAASQEDFNRASTEPSTQDTLNNEASIKDESDVETVEGDEVTMSGVLSLTDLH